MEATGCYLVCLIELENMRSEVCQISSIPGQAKALCLDKEYMSPQVDLKVRVRANLVLERMLKEIMDIRRT
jgi:hypothetical protein